MSQIPSIKGSIFGRAVEDLKKVIDAGGISREEALRRLAPGDTACLEGAIQPTSWYDVQLYGRLLELLMDVEGNGDVAYLRERGAQSARALKEAGVYQQMSYLDRTQVARAQSREERFRAFGTDLRLLVSLHNMILNFGLQTAYVDPELPDRYVLEIREADPYPTPLCWTTDGFINQMARSHDERDLWSWTRPLPDRIVFRMTRPL